MLIIMPNGRGKRGDEGRGREGDEGRGRGKSVKGEDRGYRSLLNGVVLAVVEC